MTHDEAHATYRPTFILNRLPLPPDRRTDDEKACDRYLTWQMDARAFGAADAAAAFGPCPVHPPDCAACKTRPWLLVAPP